MANMSNQVDREIVKNCREAQAEQAAYVLDLVFEGADAAAISEARADLQEIEAQLALALRGEAV